MIVLSTSWFNLLLYVALNSDLPQFNCQSYNEIPNFYFSGNDMGKAGSSDQTLTICNSALNCVGYNSQNYYKSNLQNARQINSTNFFVRKVEFGMKFMMLQFGMAIHYAILRMVLINLRKRMVCICFYLFQVNIVLPHVSNLFPLM